MSAHNDDAFGRGALDDSIESRRRSLGGSTKAGNDNRLSMLSTEAGESSRQNTTPLETETFGSPQGRTTLVGLPKSVANGKGSHRSHKSRGSGSFLLSNNTFESPSAKEQASPPRARIPKEDRSKTTTRGSDRGHSKKISSVGLGIGGSPLARNIANVASEDDRKHARVDGAEEGVDESPRPGISNPASAAALGLDSTQIVQLALNLSESRKNAARRNISTPLPPTIPGLGDGFAGAGGSLRQHLQQQRRSSRNISPKPERGVRTFTLSPRAPHAQRLDSPLQAAFAPAQDDQEYNFSASTLARAEKARNTIELMAQYRRVLQYVPPLKPSSALRVSTASPPSTAPGSPTHSTFPLSRSTSMKKDVAPLGRQYNPLQYIRNRKLRLRERKGINSEELGFDDLENVTEWVDRVSMAAQDSGYQSPDCVSLPHLVNRKIQEATQSGSPPNNATRISNRPKRPRVDWIVNPADLLADLDWLEQDDNKILIEDHRWRKIFPQNVTLTRPPTRTGEEPKTKTVLGGKSGDKHHQQDLLSPTFSISRHDEHHHSNGATGKTRQKLHNIAHLHELNRLGHEHHLLRSHSRGRSDSSGSDNAHGKPTGHGRGRSESQDAPRDLLEKQMMELLANEAKDIGNDSYDMQGQKIVQSIENVKPELRVDMNKVYSGSLRGRPTIEKPHHRRADSAMLSDGGQSQSGRVSIDGEDNLRTSLDGLDWTAPNSPETKALNGGQYFIPSIAMDLSPPTERQDSPTRRERLTNVRSKIHRFRDRSAAPTKERLATRGSGSLDDQIESNPAPETPLTPDQKKRSKSPTRTISTRRTNESKVSSKSGKRKVEEHSGIRGLFKTGRANVSKVGELFWRNHPSTTSVAVSAISSDTSTDESEAELDTAKPASVDTSKSSKLDPSSNVSLRVERSSLDLPVFRSPFEGRGRNPRSREKNSSSPDSRLSERERRQSRRQLRFDRLKPPRIDIQNASPASSPEQAPTNRSSRNSDVSDLESRRNSTAVQHSGARLNAVLGLQGHVVRSSQNGLPVTGLTSVDIRRPSMSGRQWSIADRNSNNIKLPMTRREIARLRGLLLCSGVKANEISRRAAELRDLNTPNDPKSGQSSVYDGIALLNRDSDLVIEPVPHSQEHILAAKILSNDIQLSSHMWQVCVERFSSDSVGGLLDRVDELQDRILSSNGLSVAGKQAADEADDLSRDLVEGKTMMVKSLVEQMDKMMRARRRRFRWVRRAGWVALEWLLVGVMWWLWAVVMLSRVIFGVGSGALSVVRWLLFL